MAFHRLTGKSRYKTFPSSGTIAAGSAAQFDENGEVAISATDKTIVGINLAAATSSTDATLDIIDHGSIWRCTTFTGTFTAAHVGKVCTIGAGLTPDIDATTNADATIVGGDLVGNAYVDLVFNNAGLVRTEAGAA
jgi:hypothetical protein